MSCYRAASEIDRSSLHQCFENGTEPTGKATSLLDIIWTLFTVHLLEQSGWADEPVNWSGYTNSDWSIGSVIIQLIG